MKKLTKLAHEPALNGKEKRRMIVKEDACVLGVDFGTDSVRSIIVEVSQGEEIAAAVSDFPRWRQGLYCNPAQNRFRQHPLDHLESLEAAVKETLEKSPPGTAEKIVGISVDTTG